MSLTAVWLTICSGVLFIKEAESVTVFPAAVLAIIMLFCQGGEIKIKKKKKNKGSVMGSG